MKEVYIKPQSECIEVEPTVLAASFAMDDEAKDDVVAGAQKRDRQQWGNLWE